MGLFLIVEGDSRHIQYHFECVILARNIISQQIKTLEY